MFARARVCVRVCVCLARALILKRVYSCFSVLDKTREKKSFGIHQREYKNLRKGFDINNSIIVLLLLLFLFRFCGGSVGSGGVNYRRRLPSAHASFQRRIGSHRRRDGVEFARRERVVGTQE